MMEYIKLLGLIGLLGLVPFIYKIPKETSGDKVRLLGILGLLALVGFWIDPLATCGAFGAFSLWNHPKKILSRLAYLGFIGIIGMIIFFIEVL